MPLSLEERLSLKNQALEMTAKQNNLIAMASKLPQEQALKVMNVAAYTGMDLKEAAKYPHSVIESIISPTEYESLKNDALKTYEFLQDPVYMAAVRSKRNVMNLANLEQKSQYGTALLNGIKGIGRGVLGTVKMASDFLGKGSEENQSLMSPEEKMWHQEGGTNLFHAVSEAMDNAIKSEYLKGEEREQGFWLDVAETAPQIAAQIALAFVSSGTSMAFMGSQIAGSEYLKLRDEGVDIERAGIAAVLDAAAQTPLEKIGLDRLFKAVKTTGLKEKLAEFSKTALTEAMTEWIQQYPESIVEIWAKKPNFSADERSQQFYNDFWQTTKEGAYQGLVAAPFGFLGGAVKVSMQKQVTQANAEQVSSQIDDMRKSGIDPVILQAHAESINPNDKVYIDGQALAMFQSTDTELAEQLGLTDEQIQKAATTGQDIEVPASKYKVAMMERPEIEAKLKNDIKAEEDGLTVNQAKSRNVKDIKKAQDEYLQEQNEMNIEKKKIYDNLREAGVGSEQSKNTLALLVSNAYQMSDNPAQYLRDNAPMFQRQMYVNQGGMKQPLNTDVNPDEKVQPVDITNALPETVVTNKDLVKHIKNLVAEKTQLSTADSKAIMSILPKDVKHIVYSSNKKINRTESKIRKSGLLSIKDLIKNSVLIESEPNTKTSKKPNVEAYHRFYVPVKINDKIHTVRIVAEEQKGSLSIDPKDVNLYDVIIEKNRIAQQGMPNDLSLWGADNGSFERTTPANLTQSENQKGGIVPVGSSMEKNHPTKRSTSNDAVVTLMADGSLSNISIRDMLSGVKDTDGNYYFQSEVTNTKFEKSLVSAGFKMINELTENEKSIATLGKMLGNEIRFFDGPAEFNGANRNGVSYINRNGDKGIEWAFWHESTHALKQSNPGLYNEVYEALKDTVTEKQISDYRKLLVNDILSDTEIIEEIIADEIGNIAIKPEVLKTLQQIDGNVFERFIAAIKRMFTEIKYEVSKANTGLTEEQIKLIENHSKDIFKLVDDTKYYQNENNPRGAIQWNEEGRAIITLFEKADASTIVHELVGHFFTENIMRNGKNADAPEWVKDSYNKLLKQSGLNDWDTATKEQQTEFHEKMAKWAEMYLMEGKAPSAELRGVFRRFKNWITRVYETLRQAKVEIPENVRQVFDRMLATDEAIREMEIVEQYKQRLLEKTLDGLSQLAKNELDKVLENTSEEAENILREKMMNFISADNQYEIQQERIKSIERFTKAVSSEPLYRAIDIVESDFKDGFKNAQDFAENYIKRETKENSRYNEEIEFKFDMLAESLGFSSGSELAQKILNSPSKDEEIQNRVDDHINKQFEDLYGNAEKIADEARNAMYNEEGAYKLAVEQQIIEEKLGRVLKADERRQLAALAKQEAKLMVQKEIARLPIKKATRLQTYVTAERNAAVKCQKALMKGDYESADYWKSVQLFNHAMVIESLATKRKYEGITKYLNKQKKSKKETWKKEEHFNQAAALLEKFGFSRKDFEPQPGQESLEQWVNRISEENDNIAIEPWLFNYPPTDFNSLTLEQCEDITNAVKNIKRIAQMEDKFFREDIKESISETVSTVTEKLVDRKDVYVPEAQPDIKRWSIQQYFRSAEKIATFLNKLDNWHDFGYFHDLIYKPVYDASNKASNILHEIKKLSDESLNKWYSKDEQKLLNKKIFYEELGVSVNKRYLFEMASHVGNEHNFAVLASTPPVGLKKSPIWVEKNIDATKENIMQFLENNLSYNDWQYVQDGWNIINKLWPMAQEVHAKMTGFSMKKVEAVPFKVALPDGEVLTLDGGYYPLKEDRRASNLAEKREAEGQLLYTEGFSLYTPKTFTGYTNKRVLGARYSIDLNVSNRYSHIQAVTHDIAFREVITDLRRLLNNKEFKNIIEQKTGQEGYGAIRDFVAAAATSKTNPSNIGQDFLDSTANVLREKAVVAALMFNVKTAMQNLANPFLYGQAVDGFTHIDSLHAFFNRGIFGHWTSGEQFKNDRKFVFEKSAFMRDRMETPDFIMNEFHGDKENFWTKWGGRILAETDNLTCIPAWLEAYHKKIREGANEHDAVMFADTLIERSVGSGRKIDTAPLLRGDPVSRTLTMFGSFMNTQYNAWERELGIAFRDKNPAAAGRLITMVGARILLFSIASMLLAGEFPDSEDDEWMKEWASEILTYPIKLFPILGNVGAVAMNYLIGAKTMGVRMSPIESMGDTLTRVASTGKGVIEGRKDSADFIEAGSNVASYFVPYPQQFNKWFWNAYDILANDMDPELQDIYKRRPARER